MIDLFTLAQARAHLGVLNTLRDTDIASKISQASEIVLDYITVSSDDWILDSTTSPVTHDVPPLIEAAALLVLSELFENREASTVDVLSGPVRSLLQRYHDPALA